MKIKEKIKKFGRDFKTVFKQIDEKLSELAKKYINIRLLNKLIVGAFNGMRNGLNEYLLEEGYIEEDNNDNRFVGD